MSAATIAGGGLTLGSVLANGMAAKDQQKARDAAIANQTAQQATYDQNIAGLNADSLKQFKNFGAKSATTEGKLGNLFTHGVISPDNPNSPNSVMPGTSSALVAGENAKQAGAVQALGEARAANAAALAAPTQTLFGKNLIRANDASAIAQQDNFKSGYASTLPFELQAAGMQGAGWGTLADLSKGGGQIATAIGAPGTAQMFASNGTFGKQIGSWFGG